ncbi:MAG: hypothetical protein ACOZAR_00750 [Patescibacteria group bacterium]
MEHKKVFLFFAMMVAILFGGMAYYAQAKSVKVAVVDNLVENGDVTAVACHPNMSKIKISGTGTVGRSIWVVLDSPFSNSNLNMIQCGKTMDTYDSQHPMIGQDLVGTDGKFDCYIDIKDLEGSALKGRNLYVYTKETYMYKLKGSKQGQPAPNCSIWSTNFVCNSQDTQGNYNTLEHSLNIKCAGKEYYNKASRTGDMNETIMLPEGESCEATCHSLDSNYQMYGFSNSNSLGVIPDNQLTKTTNEKVMFTMDKFKPVYRWIFKDPGEEPVADKPLDITCFSDETDRIRLSGTSNIEPGIDELGLNIFYGDNKDQAELLFGFASYKSTPEQQWHIFDKNFVIDLNKSLLKNQSGKFYVYTGSYDQTFQGEVSMQCTKTVKYNQPPDTVKPTFGRGNLCQSSGKGCSCLDNGITTFEGYASFMQDGTELNQGWFEMYTSESENYSKSNGNLLFGLLVRRDFTGQINTNLLNLDFSKQNIFFDFPDKGEEQVLKLQNHKDIFKCIASDDDTCIAENQNIVTGKSCCSGLVEKDGKCVKEDDDQCIKENENKVEGKSCCAGLEVKDGKCVKTDTSKVKFKLIGNVRDSESKEKIADVGSNVKMTIECDDGKVRNLSTKDGYFIYNITNLPVSGCKLINNTDALVRDNWSIADYEYKGYTLCKDSEIGKTNASCATNVINKNSWDMSSITDGSKYQIVYLYDKLDVENEPVNADLEDKIDQLILMIKKILEKLGISL